MLITSPPVLQLLTTVRVSDADDHETVAAETVALGAEALHAETVMLEGVVAALAGVAIMRVEIPNINTVEAEKSLCCNFTRTSYPNE